MTRRTTAFLLASATCLAFVGACSEPTSRSAASPRAGYVSLIPAPPATFTAVGASGAVTLYGTAQPDAAPVAVTLYAVAQPGPVRKVGTAGTMTLYGTTQPDVSAITLYGTVEPACGERPE